MLGDPRAVPCPADSVIAYNGTAVDADRLGAGPVNSDGSFDPFDIGIDPDAIGLHLPGRQAGRGRDAAGSAAADPLRPDLLPDVYAEQIFDPWNPYQVYNAGDYLNIRLRLDDRINATGAAGGRNDCADVWADFSRIDSTGVIPAGFSETPEHITFYGLGRDRKDNDGDWWALYVRAPTTTRSTWGSTESPSRVTGEDDGKPTAGDPYVDENGNGSYDPGETFLDVVNQTGISGVWDPGEPNLDSLDPDEKGWYEVRSNTRTTWGTVSQGFPLVEGRVRNEARLDPFTLVTIYLRDNGIDNVKLTDTSNRTSR